MKDIDYDDPYLMSINVKTPNPVIYCDGSDPVYVYNFNASMYKTTAQHTRMYTSGHNTTSFIPMYIGGQFNSLTGYTRSVKTLYDHEFRGFFADWKDLRSISKVTILPYGGNNYAIPTGCFYRTFSGCTNLTGSLHWNNNMSGNVDGRDEYIYVDANGLQEMFIGCTSLTSWDNTLYVGESNIYAFAGMFKNCTGLNRFELIQNSINNVSYAFSEMFQGCTNISTPDITLTFNSSIASYCYMNMFSGCTSFALPPKINRRYESISF